MHVLRSKCKEMIDRRRDAKMNRIFQQWFDQSYSSQINRKAITHHRNKITCAVWSEWKGHLIVYQRNNAKAMEYYNSKLRPQELRETLISWRIVSRHQKATKSMVSVVDSHRRRQSLEFVVTNWIVFNRRQQRLNLFEGELEHRLTMKYLRDSWDEWRYQFMIMEHINHVQAVQCAEMIRDCFVSWRTYSDQERAMRAKTTFIRMELRSKPETKALCEEKMGNLWKNMRHPVFRHFLSWRLAVEETKKREQDHQIAKSHHDRRVYGVYFKIWRDLFHEALAMSQASGHHERRLIKSALDEWVSLHSVSRNMKQLMAKADDLRMTQSLRRQLTLWVEVTRRRSALKEKEVSFKKTLRDRKVMHLMQRWTASASKLQLRRKRTWMSYEFRANQLKRGCLRIWIREFRRHSSLKQRERQFVAMQRYKRLQDVFYKWCNTYNGLIYKADLLKSHFEELRLYRMSTYFTTWYSVFECVRDTRERYLMAKVFADWKHATKRRNQFKKQILRKPYMINQHK